MKFYVGITDANWFQYLKTQKPDEINFWRPSARNAFRAIEPGAPFLFKMHKPNDYIVGGGFFSGYSRIPLSMAWQTFQEKNGAPDFLTFRNGIATYRANHNLQTVDPEIGCIILSEPFFFDEADRIAPPNDWGAGIMQGKTYDSLIEPGATLWKEVLLRLNAQKTQLPSTYVHEPIAHDAPVLGKQYLRTARLGQGAFRLLTLENFKHKCCVTGETTVPVLEAAHIRPVKQDGRHALRNGLLLRADIHILYDRGLIGIDADYKIRISSEIRNQYLNGKVYYVHDGLQLRSLPETPELCPDRELLDWRMKEYFIP